MAAFIVGAIDQQAAHAGCAHFAQGYFFGRVSRAMIAFLLSAITMAVALHTFMTEYRAYAAGPDGRFIGFEPLICADDHEAIEKAKSLIDKYANELWSGNRFIKRLSAAEKLNGEE